MENQLSRIEGKLERLSEKLEIQTERLAAIEADLRHHIKRSDSLEFQVEELKRFMWKALGALAVVGPLVSFLIQLAMK